MLQRITVVVGLVACVCALGSAGSARAESDGDWCSAHPTLETCVVSASIDGYPITASDLQFDVAAYPVSGAKTVRVWVQKTSNEGDLSDEIGDTFSVTIRTNAVPSMIAGFGDAMRYTRTPLGSGEYEVEISGRPVSVTDIGGCGNTSSGPTCTEVAPGSSVILEADISAFRHYSDYRKVSFYGMDSYTNVTYVNLPPWLLATTLTGGKKKLRVGWLVDHHFEPDGTTVVNGDFSLRIPAAFLKTYWGIDDPKTLATDALSASVPDSSLAISVGLEPGRTGVQVKVSGLMFPKRTLTVALGHVAPHPPRNVNATRSSPTTARVTFTAAEPRGQTVRGYVARCKGRQTLEVRGRHSPATVEGLTPRVPYLCRLQARSQSGYGERSTRFYIRG